MKIINLSYYLSEATPCFGGAKNISFEVAKSINCGHSSNSFYVRFHNHVGTHIDFPLHFNQSGKSLSQYNLNDFIFSRPYSLKIKVDQDQLIGSNDLKKHSIPHDIDILLLNTGFSKNRNSEAYWKNNPGIDVDVASYIRTNFPYCRAIGFDFISLTAFQHREIGRLSHVEFLGDLEKPIWIIEDMNLSLISGNQDLNQIIVSPLLIEGADGAPVTVWGFSNE